VYISANVVSHREQHETQSWTRVPIFHTPNPIESIDSQ